MTDELEKAKRPEKGRPWYYWLTYIWTCTHDIITMLVVFLIWLFWGTRLSWNEGLWCELKPKSWPARTWYRHKKDGKPVENPEHVQEHMGKWKTWGGTTLGHGGFYGPGRMYSILGEDPENAGDIDTEVEYHEHIHVDQYESNMLRGMLMGITLFGAILGSGGDRSWALLIGMLTWTFWTWMVTATNALQAVIRGESAYRGSVHEEHAYAAAEEFIKKKHGH